MAGDAIRIGVIGASAKYGWSMRSHLPALRALPEYELTAVCTAHQETADKSAKHFGARLAFHDYHDMVKHPDIDLVSISVRVPEHHAMVMAALEAGKHIFCEWPLGANLKEAEEMAATASSKGVRGMVGLQARAAPPLLRLKELVEDGYVGDVLACNMTMFLPGVLSTVSRRAWMADRTMGGNTLSIATGHSTDVICFCLGEFTEVSASAITQVRQVETSDTGEKVDVTSPDNIIINGVLSNGAVASVHVAAVPWHGTGWRMEVYGREGTLVATCRQMVQLAQVTLSGARGGENKVDELPIPDHLSWVPEDVPKTEPFNVAQLYRRLARAIGDGGQAEPDFDLAVKRHRLLDAIQRSSDQGTKVQVL